MKVIYHCYGGTHSSVTAAAIHLGMLPEDRVPGPEEFLQLPLYDRQDACEHGHIFFIGIDEYGHEVYLTARRSRPAVLENVFAGLGGIFGIPASSYCLVNAMSQVNWIMMFGGYLSRRWGLIGVGRPIVTMGTRVAYFKLVGLVKKTKEKLRADGEKSSLFQQQPLSRGDCCRRYSYRPAPGGERPGRRQFSGAAVFEYARRRRG
ncbi:hypothetical protein Psfp_00599 [Pelotomaculum sp. FP]|uniref:DUF3189 family protein n=1 Tax=Pelotomaculum sp. FP TaxID=261474 RepID=UPI00110160CA|nr:DUF3189 family protein [Pelotomaculum sp. FP]TEB17375.1 hypothetical protein Psfp_00599 [Pelotomaculum sp. FP]